MEWALDLRGAELGEVELRTVPADKVLRDPTRHRIARLDRMRDDSSWRSLEDLPAWVPHWLDSPLDRMIVVLNGRSKRAERDAAAYDRLSAKGFME